MASNHNSVSGKRFMQTLNQQTGEENVNWNLLSKEKLSTRKYKNHPEKKTSWPAWLEVLHTELKCSWTDIWTEANKNLKQSESVIITTIEAESAARQAQILN